MALNTFRSLSHTSVVSLPRRRHRTLLRTTLAPSAQRHARPVQAIGRGVFVCKPPMGLLLPVSPASSTKRFIGTKAILDVARVAHTRISLTSLFDTPRRSRRPESDSRDANSRTKLRSPYRRPALFEATPRMRAPDAPLHPRPSTLCTSPSSRRTPRGVICPENPPRTLMPEMA
jgi:hypothetical protein